MASPSQNNDGIASGQIRPQTTWGEYNNIAFAIQQAMGKMQTSTLVKVISCTNAGGISPVGFVNVTPMVNQIDGQGNAEPHGAIYNVPYIRIQGGANAVIIDPQAGDIGLACFASRDISKIKATKKQGNPGSYRQFSFGDALYVGGTLNATPTQYIQFSSSGIKVLSPTAINVEAPNVTVTASTKAKVYSPAVELGASGGSFLKLVNDTFKTLFNAHIHPDPVSGSTGEPTVLMDDSHLTTNTKAT